MEDDIANQSELIEQSLAIGNKVLPEYLLKLKEENRIHNSSKDLITIK